MNSSQASKSIATHPLATGRRLGALTCLFSVATIASSFAISGVDARLGLPPASFTADSPARIALGQRVFFDKRLSSDGTISCASCHIPERAFSDGRTVARGVRELLGTRNTPSLWNVAFATSLFWDGRRPTLEEQATDPLLNPREHGLATTTVLLTTVRQDDTYGRDFMGAFNVRPDEIAVTHVVTVLAAFERALVAGDSPFDRYLYGHDRNALSPAAIRGLNLFRGRAQCNTCHVIGEHYALLTDNLYHSVGEGLGQVLPHLAQTTTRIANQAPAVLDHLIGSDPEVAALGRFVVTRQPRDIGSFKTPSLRNVALTAPYMHDGNTRTLEEALELELYYRGIELHAPLILTPAE